MPILFRDYETYSTLHLPDVGAWRYAGDASTGVWCVSFAVDDDPVQTWLPGQSIPKEFQIAATDPTWLVVAHADSFESTIEEHLLGPRYGWPLIPIERHRCTQAMALAAALPAKLETLAEALQLPISKDTDGARVMREMAKPRKPRPGEDPRDTYWVDDPEKLRRLIAYNVRDVELEREVYRRLLPLSDAEQILWQLDAVINRRGFHVDVALAEAAHKVVRERRNAINQELTELTGGRITSIAQVNRIADYLKERGHKIAGVGKRSVSAVLAHEPDADVERLLRLRQEGGKSSASKLDSLLAMANDDRIHGTLKYHGASTGRWTGHGFQPHNLARAQPADSEAAIAAVLSGNVGRVAKIGPPLDVIGSLSRAMINAGPGKLLLSADFSSIESRVLCWLAGETWKLDAFRRFDTTGDLALENYCVVASRVLGRTVTPADEEGRQIGKYMELAFGYGGALGAFRKIAPDAEFTDAQVETFKRQWRAAHPRIIKFWGDLHRLLLRTVRTGKPGQLNNFRAEMRDLYLYLYLPSGRAIVYPQARIEAGQYNGQVIYKDNAKGKWNDARGWHGTFVENVVQAVSRDLLVAAMQRLEAAGYPIVLHVHDEIVAEVDEHFGSPEEFARLMTELPSWAEGLPVAAKASRGKRYAKDKNSNADDKVDELGELLDADASKPAPATQAGIDEINAGLVREGVEPININATAIETASPALAAGIAAMAAAVSSGTIAGRDASNGDDHAQQTDNRSRGSRVDNFSEKHCGKPYTDAHLRRQGYQLACSFPYELPDGTKLYEERRYELRAGIAPTKERPRKTCRFCHVVDGITLFDTGRRRIIFNWPAIMRAGPDAVVHITEGANKSAALNKAGLLATAVAYHQWVPECVAALAGRHLIYHEDFDDNGRKFSADARKHLAPVAASFRIVPAAHLFKQLGREPWPTADVKDWITAGGDAAKLTEICREIPTENRITVKPYRFPDERDITPWQWLYGRHLLRGEVAGTAAMGGTGKSTLSIVEALAMTTGRPLLGQDVAEPRRVMLVNLEDTRNTMDKRIAAVMRHYAIAPGDVGDRLIVKAKGEIKIKVARQLHAGDVERNEPLLRELTALMIAEKIDVLSIDSFIRTHKVNENDNSAIQEVIECFEDIANEAQCAVHLWHHTRKAGGEKATIESARGAIAFVDACRSARVLEKMSSKQHAELEEVQPDMLPAADFYFRAFNGKRNFAPPADQSEWFVLESVTLARGDDVGVAAPWHYPETWAELEPEMIERIIGEIDKGLANGRRYSNSNAAKERGAYLAVQKHCPGKTVTQGRTIVTALIKQGKLYEDEYEDPIQRRKQSGLFARKAIDTTVAEMGAVIVVGPGGA
jgi:DNA polymerase bacteriophage-type